ncbi:MULTISPECIES: RagB/SusD family nutrient uptake outer membrane protein [Bacteroides]|jgi:hypothetical protein|uniref:RagB/SusD family nutrient uptake outer membrane protein n=2 Tax=Bacteroides TaxID=816 RepID=UPI0009349BAB|nr:RagB/SusD family nutrient uptake outer membrane protein [Bacteroides congonensis]
MKRLGKIRHAMCALGVAVLITSCTDNYKEWNTNPNEVPEEMLVGLMKIGNFFPAMQMDVIPTSDVDANEFQRAQNLCGDMHSGYMTPIGTWGTSSAVHYNLRYDKWNDVAFDVVFTKVMPAWKQIRDNGKDKFPEAYAVAQILKVAAMHRVTDMYGPLPYLQFGHGGLETPYDSQEEIYKSFFIDLDEAIAELQDYIAIHPGSKPLSKYDLVYGGDFTKWLKFANSLKLRLAMRTYYVNGFEVNGKTSQKLAEEATKAGVITENAENALLQSGNGISVFHPLKICWDSYSDTRMGADIESIMKGYSDPRLSKYFQQSEYGEAGDKFHGARLGVNVTDKKNYLKLSSPNVFAETPVQWMCAAEIYFLRAEGKLHGWDMGGEVEELYNAGITKSFEQWGVALDDYLTRGDTYKPVRFTAPAGTSGSVAAASTITIAWNKNDSDDKKLERIITQKWIAMFPEGQEAWSEHRRTGYPKLFSLYGTNASAGQVESSGPRRIPFPSTEYDTNTTEVNKAVTDFLGGTDYGKVKLWWDKK